MRFRRCLQEASACESSHWSRNPRRNQTWTRVIYIYEGKGILQVGLGKRRTAAVPPCHCAKNASGPYRTMGADIYRQISGKKAVQVITSTLYWLRAGYFSHWTPYSDMSSRARTFGGKAFSAEPSRNYGVKRDVPFRSRIPMAIWCFLLSSAIAQAGIRR
jgi:hypothetical protein